ncbi:putative G2/M phase-specific E3 ubiquitin-protein ligase-like [Triplophysa rosa]|uniref:G2/M phase-specific E3 ubiquitin-protein ligase-like n=1 Tax=Triplophysa rosa TaxID=992332 RepID=A0A9W7X0Q5_TRIRA|nr:putative G2/M phase-specific E3 ubiquitin-protein ligase-like [Triplophysa rosa]
MAVSLAQGGPPPVFLREWCFQYLCSGDHDSIRVNSCHSTDDMSEFTDEIVGCGYTGKVSVDMKSNIIRAIVLHSTMRVVPMLEQLRKGLQLYDLQKVMHCKPGFCVN